jgi:enoyl-CoA hydratase/carnithine racemase
MPVTREIEGHVVTITIDGYNDLNPMTQEMYLELHHWLVELDDTPSQRVGILRGAGERAFSAGGNLKAYHGAQQALPPLARVQAWWYPHAADPQALSLPRVTILGRRQVKPLIAAVRGYCLGAALMIFGLHTSIRIAGETAQFGLSEILRGLGGSATVRSLLPRQLPYTAAMWLAMTGRTIDAQTALRVGLVTEVVPDHAVLSRAREVAEMIAGVGPTAVLAGKQAYYQADRQPQARLAAFASALGTLNRLDPDLLEAYDAFFARRPATFSGLAGDVADEERQ